MSIIEDISRVTSLPYDTVLSGLNVSIFSNSSVTISNFVSILSYTNSKIILKTKDNCFIINGENLYINDLDKKQLIIVGKIISCEFSR